ncbi:MAG: class I tRNA ligase family protein, partial [Neisseriaceae bacterium]|nr:class I tRNA ligase family protein [Neisseriaceae bacterium]
ELTQKDLTGIVKALRFKLHTTIDKVTEDYDRRQQFNTAIAAIMELLNLYEKTDLSEPHGNEVATEMFSAVFRMLWPIVPHIAEALWNELELKQDILEAGWPEADKEALVPDEVELMVQVNGKLRGRITVSLEASKDEIERLAQAEQSVLRHIEGKTIKKIIIVPKRLVNIVAV